MDIGIIILLVIVVLALFAIVWFISARNKFVVLRNKVEEGYATIEVYLKKRYDLIPNLLETVKGYVKHEKETFIKVTEARNGAINASPAEQAVAENNLSNTLKSLFAVAESYPELKADSQFINLQNQLTSIETELAQSRKYYNALIKNFNTSIEVFPANIVANMMKLEKKEYFQIEDSIERQNVKISF